MKCPKCGRKQIHGPAEIIMAGTDGPLTIEYYECRRCGIMFVPGTEYVSPVAWADQGGLPPVPE